MSSRAQDEPRIRDGMRAALPLAPSPILFGLSYGVLADATGFGTAAAVVMSATTFAGAAQFASLSVLDAGGTIAAAVLAAVFLNARYVAISVTVASIFPGASSVGWWSPRRSWTSPGLCPDAEVASNGRSSSGRESCSTPCGSEAPPRARSSEGSWRIRTRWVSMRPSRRSSSPWRSRICASDGRVRLRHSPPSSLSR